MRTLIKPSTIEGEIVAPPSKSVMLRVTAAALLAGKTPTTILNPSHCVDAVSGLRVIEALGAESEVEHDAVRIVGGIRPRHPILDCGESGLCLRMFTAIAALASEELTLSGTGSLLRRPTTTVQSTIAELGAFCRTNSCRAPILVRGPLLGGEAQVDGSVAGSP